MAKALVTGGCGFIGSHLVDLLLEEGLQVQVLDNCSTGRLQNLAHQRENPLLKIEVADLADEDFSLETIVKDCDYVFHLAALADIVPSILNPEAYYRSNVHGTLRLLEALRKTGPHKKILYAASSSCYGLATQYPTPETAEIKPEYPYALTKRLGEELLLHWGKLYKMPVISLRLFNVFGPRSRTSGTYGAVFGVFLKQKLANQQFTVVGDGTQTRDFTYVEDVARAFYQASKSSVQGEVFNVGSGGHYSVNYLVELLGGSKTHIPKRPGEPDCTFADISKIKKMIQWQPQVKFEDGVKQLLAQIDYWKDAPLWTPEKIAEETKSWFQALS